MTDIPDIPPEAREAISKMLSGVPKGPPPGPDMTGMTEVAFTYYPKGGEVTHWYWLPSVPRIGERVHLPIITDGEPDSLAFTVGHVAWTDDHPEHPGWHAEIGLR